tara:strand:+ start:756 stop:1706 length:951 start_codon:yes stop_codon:yes gene_type:complete
MTDNYAIKKILITGGSGMVGRNFFEHHKSKGYSILRPKRTEMNLLNFNEIDNYLLKNKPDLIIHAAARVGGIQANIKNPTLFLCENVDLGKNLLLAAKKQNIKKVINLSSSCVYPKNMETPLEEDFILSGSLEPTNEAYAIGKIFTQKLCSYINKEFAGFSYKTLIPCNLFGKYDNFDLESGHLLPNIINKIHNAKINKLNTVTIWGDGSVKREFMYVKDLIDCIYYSIEKFSKMPEIMNVGVGKDYSVLDYYNFVAQSLDWKGDFEFDMKKPVGQKQKLVSVKRLNKFGWQSKTPLQNSINETVNYYIESYKHGL